MSGLFVFHTISKVQQKRLPDFIIFCTTGYKRNEYLIYAGQID